jgi:hypothetical protein
MPKERFRVKAETVPEVSARKAWSCASREERRLSNWDTLMPAVDKGVTAGIEEEEVGEEGAGVEEAVRSILASALPTMLPETERNWTKTVSSPAPGASIQGREVTYGIQVELAKLEMFETSMVYASVP